MTLTRDFINASTQAGRAWAVGAVVLLSNLAASAAIHGKTPALELCDQESFQTLLHASPAGPVLEARAYWLTGQIIQWPTLSVQGHFKLYHSATGQIKALPGAAVSGADGSLSLEVTTQAPAPALAARFKFVPDGVRLSVRLAQRQQLSVLLQQQLILVQEDDMGQVRHATRLQAAGALDELYARAEELSTLGVTLGRNRTHFALWAPTARQVSVCIHDPGASKAVARVGMQFDRHTGVWAARRAVNWSGKYYTYLVDVFVPGVGVVRNRVTDPYSISLNADSRRSYIGDLGSAALTPPGWEKVPAPAKVKAQTDMVVYELHVRDFSINDASVDPAHRGKYLAFTHRNANGMKHLQALSAAGLTDVHLLPVFDLASIPEAACVTPRVATAAAADSEAQQAAVMASAAGDCFNWGYDPYHFNAPEGSYASTAANGATRIRELRQMVMALHRAGLRVGMDVVYNHTATSGQKETSVLDRIVPGYYQRQDGAGAVERSTCCDNTATEHMMMGKLMVDSVALWATQYKIDSFRFDLMGHQPRATMETLQRRVNQRAGRSVHLIGEGWNFGEIADGARFIQASQLSLNGSGIGTFSDRSRDAVRGGRAADSGEALLSHQGYINGLVYDRNAMADPGKPLSDLMQAADMVRVGLAGSLRDYELLTYLDQTRQLQDIDYSGQPAGYVSQPGEVVNYVENHDNQTLFDINAYKLPLNTSPEDRARVQMLGAAINVFSQGVAYFHAGIDTLRSKSMDANSYDSGDWFNRLDWTYNDNYFGTGAPPKGDNGRNYGLIKPLLVNPALKPGATEIRWARDMFRDLLKLRASSTLFRLPTADAVKTRLKFYNTGSRQQPTLLVGHLDGTGYPGAAFKELMYFVNVDKLAHDLALPEQQGKPYLLHPVHRAAMAADARPAAEARYESSSGRFTIPARSALVFVVN